MINPASDIVLDVARAANGSEAERAMARLGEDAAVEPQFRRALAAAAPPPRVVTATAEPAPAAPGPWRGLEALLLAQLVETMLPRRETAFLGAGFGAGVARSLLAEALAQRIARSGGVGLARVLSAHAASSGRAGGAT